MNLTPAAYALALTLGLIALAIAAFPAGWPLVYLVALPAALCSSLLTMDLMVRYSRFNRA